MNSLLLWIGGLLVAVLASLFAIPYVVDWNAYRGVFEEEASRILGRDVRVGGEVNLRLLPAPYVRFEKVRISDAGASLGEPFFRAEAFTLWLAAAPLLRGTVEASEVELDRPVLRLAVDQDGRGNWQEIKISPGALPFVPNDVILQQVKVKDGVVSLRAPGIVEPLALTNIDGELAASSLEGPYRFRGLVDWLGARRELRIGTSQREADGTLRYKASVRSPDNDNVYAIDGMLSELSPRGRHTGTLTAKLPLANVFGGLMPSDGGARPLRGNETIDLTGKLEGDLEGARLADLAFAFEHDGKPQLVSGELTANWRQGLRVETRLASRWLDLDQIVSKEGRKAPPIDTVRRLIGQASALLPLDGTSLVTFDIDQVNLGGEALSGIRLALARAGGLTSIGEFRAELPGNARGSMRGTLGAVAPTGTRPAAQQPRGGGAVDTFDGEIVLHGPGYRRFAAWAGVEGLFAAQTGDPQAQPDAPFSIASRLRLAGDGVALTNAQIELGPTRVVASADWRWGATRQLDMTAEGRTIDISPIAPGSLDLTRQPTAGAGNGSATLAETGSMPLIELASRVASVDRSVGELRLKLRAQSLTDGQVSFDDVDADLEMKSGTATIKALTATTPSGAHLDLKGRIDGINTKPSGTLRGWASATTNGGVRSMITALPPAARTATAPWLATAARADLGFALVLGGKQPDAVALTANGSVDGARTIVDLKLDGGLARWREAPIRLSLDLEGAAAVRPLRLLTGRSPGQSPGESAGTSADRSAMSVQAAGASAGALLVTARAETRRGAEPTSVGYDGKAALLPDGDVELDGGLRIAAASADDLIALAGGPRRSIAPRTTVHGAVDLAYKTGAMTLTTRNLEMAGTRVGGTLTIARKGDRTRLDGQLTSDRLEIAGLLGLLLDDKGKPAEMSDDGPSPWPDAPFSPGLVDGLEGLVVINAATARLTPDLSMTDAEARIAFSPGRIELQSLGGAALGGRFNAHGSLERAQAGAEVSLEARLTGAHLAQINKGVAKPSSGEADVVLSMTSRGLSPRAVMSTASGKGEIEIRDGRIPGLGAELVEKAAAAAIEASEAINRAQIERLILAERGRSSLALGNRKLAVEIVDGAARVAALEISQPEATLRNVTTVDLAQLKADSAWQIVSRRALPGSGRTTKREPLPALGMVWAGPLGSIARQEPQLSVDALERELTIRKLERDAEKLEDLRRQDEERVRHEIERRRMENQSSATTSSGSGTAPVIQVPLPIPPQVAPQPGAAAATGVTVAPPPRVVRPPPSPRPREQKTLQDLLLGQ